MILEQTASEQSMSGSEILVYMKSTMMKALVCTLDKFSYVIDRIPLIIARSPLGTGLLLITATLLITACVPSSTNPTLPPPTPLITTVTPTPTLSTITTPQQQSDETPQSPETLKSLSTEITTRINEIKTEEDLWINLEIISTLYAKAYDLIIPGNNRTKYKINVVDSNTAFTIGRKLYPPNISDEEVRNHLSHLNAFIDGDNLYLLKDNALWVDYLQRKDYEKMLYHWGSILFEELFHSDFSGQETAINPTIGAHFGDTFAVHTKASRFQLILTNNLGVNPALEEPIAVYASFCLQAYLFPTRQPVLSSPGYLKGGNVINARFAASPNPPTINQIAAWHRNSQIYDLVNVLYPDVKGDDTERLKAAIRELTPLLP